MPTPPRLVTPGVFVNELNAFPDSVVPVATAVPAFIGYTARASYGGKSYTNVPVKITAFQQFLAIFGLLDGSGIPLPGNQQYTPVYYPVPSTHPSTADLVVAGQSYDVEPDPTTVYYLYNSIKLFYANGGGTCYVVSVGGYGPARGTPKAKADPLLNPNVDLAHLTGGLKQLLQENAPTMVVVPEATLLSPVDNQALNQAVLLHCSTTKSRIGLLDVPGGDNPDPILYTTDIGNFRAAIGVVGLDYGAAYYPFLKTSVMADQDINFVNLGGSKALAALLPGASTDPLKTLIASIDQAAGPNVPSSLQIENALLNASVVYSNFHDVALAKMNTLPPSGALAGAYTLVDNQQGVWHAPANLSLMQVNDTTLKITDTMQGNLNVDAASGKSINAIRLFPGKGVLVWGARTLDGNSQDWRYINVRRTMIMLEQSMILAANGYVFQPNNPHTWSLVKSMLNSFLTTMWSEGALVGPTPADAFSVSVGLGATMTADDILNGIMNISVKVAVSHPGEFLVITIQQQQQSPA